MMTTQNAEFRADPANCKVLLMMEEWKPKIWEVSMLFSCVSMEDGMLSQIHIRQIHIGQISIKFIRKS